MGSPRQGWMMLLGGYDYRLLGLSVALAIAIFLMIRMLRAQHAAAGGAPGRELYFRTLAESLPQMIWTASTVGSDDFFNRKWFEYTGLTMEQSQGSGWTATIHPEDVDPCVEKWKTALQTGEPYEVEYRIRRASDGCYRWFLGRGNPLRDANGEIVKWFGTCTDIEDQKHHLQVLELQIQERTEELAGANIKLQEEMREKDLARHELDRRNEIILQEVTARSHRATLLAQMGQLLQSCLTRDEAFAAALGFAPKIFPDRRGTIFVLNAGAKLAEAIGGWNDCELPMQAFDPASCWALRIGHLHLVVAGDTTAPCAHAAGVKHSYVCVPIVAQGQTLGLLHIQATDGDEEFAGTELSLKTTFAGQLGLSIANIRLRDALRAQSVRDALTGLYNRRYLEEVLDREIRRAVRAEQSLALLMLDLDHFKKFNDNFGHEAGDAVLRETAALLTKSIRVEDVACRYGGEEFVIILPTADLNAGLNRAERIRAKLRESKVVYYGQTLPVITASIGVAALPLHGISTLELLSAADAALYRAKHEGRDRVVAAAVPANIETKAESATAG